MINTVSPPRFPSLEDACVPAGWGEAAPPPGAVHGLVPQERPDRPGQHLRGGGSPLTARGTWGGREGALFGGLFCSIPKPLHPALVAYYNAHDFLFAHELELTQKEI